MKKILLLLTVVFAASSCATLHRSQTNVSDVYSPAVETATVATIEVSPKKITYRYIPDKESSKSLSLNQLIQNAIYAALQENGNADELVEVSYYISAKRVFMGKRIRSINVSGYPAYYVEFREPSDVDLKNVETLSRARMLRQSDIKAVELHTAE